LGRRRSARQLREENARLKRLVADLTLDRQILQDVVKKSGETRSHATLRERPIDRFAFERADLQPLPLPYGGRRAIHSPTRTIAVPLPVESLQHPLAVYQTPASS